MKNPFLLNTDNKLDLAIWLNTIILLGLLIFSTASGQALAVLLITLGFIKIIKEKRFSFLKNPVLIPFIIFLFLRITSIIFSKYPSLSISALYKELFFYLVVFVFFDIIFHYEKKRIRLLFQLLISAALAASLIGITKVLLGSVERASSTTSGYSTLGIFLSVVLAIVFPLGRNKDFFKSRMLWIIILIVLLSGILFTYNRSNWISVSLIIVIIGFIKERVTLLVLFLFFLLMIILSPALSQRFYELVNLPQHLSERDIIWRGALTIYDKHPYLGFGPRTFTEIFPLYNELINEKTRSWHNEFIQIYIESGIFALITFLWLMVSIFYFGFKLLKNPTSKFKSELIISVMAGLSIFYLNGFSSGFLFDPVINILYFFLLAMLGSLISK